MEAPAEGKRKVGEEGEEEGGTVIVAGAEGRQLLILGRRTKGGEGGGGGVAGEDVRGKGLLYLLERRRQRERLQGVAVLLLLVLSWQGVDADSTNNKWRPANSCNAICDVSSSLFAPQKCDDCCTTNNVDNTGASGGGGDIATGSMAEMEEVVKELRVMVGVLLALVVLLLVVVVALLFRLTSGKVLKVPHPVSFRNKDEGRASIEKRPPPATSLPNENRNSTVVRIADYQNNHSPLNRRVRPNGQVVPDRPTTEHPLPHYGEVPRGRQPSESTCPDDSTDQPQPHQHAYDNLALSTSTLHDTTTSSTSTLGAAVSTNTLDTTLPSVQPTTPVLRSVST